MEIQMNTSIRRLAIPSGRIPDPRWMALYRGEAAKKSSRGKMPKRAVWIVCTYAGLDRVQFWQVSNTTFCECEYSQMLRIRSDIGERVCVISWPQCGRKSERGRTCDEAGAGALPGTDGGVARPSPQPLVRHGAGDRSERRTPLRITTKRTRLRIS